MAYLQLLLQLGVWLMSAAIILSVVISWLRAAGVRVPYSNPFIGVADSVADLMLRPIRNAFPTTAGGLDFAPVVALVILQIISMLIRRLPMP